MGVETTGVTSRRWPAWLPRGGSLPEEAWRARHRVVVTLLALHAPAIPVYAVLRGRSVSEAMLVAAPVVLAVVLSLHPALGRAVRSGAATLGLMACSAVLVHLSGGLVEAHLHVFVMIPLIALYEAWAPMALGVGFVLVHHGVVGTLRPRSIFDHPAAWEHPWASAWLHAALVAAAGAACLVGWWLREQSREPCPASDPGHRADHDLLTGLPDRTAFLRLGAETLGTGLGAGSGARVESASVLVFDVDGFMDVNDTLGHQAGDHLMEQVAARLQSAVRPGDLLSRLGGDEYAVLLLDTDPAQARELALGFLQVLDHDFVVDGTLLRVNASIGTSTGTGAAAHDLPTLLRQADVAMRDAKQHRRGVTVYDSGTDHHTRARLTLMGELRRALEGDELTLHFQPKVSATDGSLVGVEALVRWQHPVHGLLAPGSFIPAAERIALIVPLTTWVIDAALRQARTWGSEGRRVQVAVNVAPRCLLEPGFADDVLEALERAGVDGACLRLEITESTLLADPDRARTTLVRLSEAGIGLSIDDFGTGYSSMSYLRHLPIDELKIDRSFVTDMVLNRDDAVLVQSAIDLGHNLGMSVVAEGVETQGVLAALQGAGCDVVQGFLFARPMPSASIDEWFEAGPGDTPPGVDLPVGV